MPRYQHAQTFDIVRSVRGAQNDIRSLQIQNAGVVRKSLNQSASAINYNPYFWGMDDTGWNVAGGGTFAVVSDPPDPAPFPYAGLYVNDAVTAGAMATSSAVHPVVARQQYMIQAWVNSSGTAVQIGADWYNSAMGVVTGPTNPTVTVTPNTWTPIQAIISAPAGAAFANPRIGVATATGDIMYVQSVTTMPSNIPGVWNDMRPLLNSFVGTIAGQYPPQYRLSADGYVDVAGWLKTPPTTGNYNAVNFFNIASGFRPTTGPHSWLVTGVADGAASPKVSVDASGNFFLNFLPASLAQTTISIYGRYPLDSSGLILS